MGSGKTFLSDYLIENFGFTGLALADPIKEIFTHAHGGRTVDKTRPEDRVAMQKIGAFGRDIDPDFWCDITRKKIPWDRERYIITDCRFPNEADFFFDFVKIKVNVNEETRRRRLTDRDGFINESAMEDASETQVDAIEPHFEISNDDDDTIPQELLKLLGGDLTCATA